MENIENQKTEEREEKLLNKLEACLFLAARYMDLDDLVRFTEMNPLIIKELIEKLKQRHSDKGIVLKERIINGKPNWKMDVKSEFAHLINKIATGESEFTKSEQQTLAVIAYKHPIKQSIVVKIRGNKAYDHIKNFREIGLIRAKKSGRTQELSLTDKFHDYFQLSKQNKEIIENIGRKENEINFG